MARELSPDSSFQVCVTEGQYHPSHNKEDNMIEIPLHVYGHDYKYFNNYFSRYRTLFPVSVPVSVPMSNPVKVSVSVSVSAADSRPGGGSGIHAQTWLKSWPGIHSTGPNWPEIMSWSGPRFLNFVRSWS